MKNLSDAEKWKQLAEYDRTQAASAISEETQASAGKIAKELGVSYMVGVISQLDTAEAAEVLRSLPDEFSRSILTELQSRQFEKLKDIQEILSYRQGTAGSIMSKEVLYVLMGAKVKEVIDYIQRIPKHKKGKVSYIYVVDSERRLV